MFAQVLIGLQFKVILCLQADITGGWKILWSPEADREGEQGHSHSPLSTT
jgi:hypothetical protein